MSVALRIVLMLMLFGVSDAGLIAHYDFSDGDLLDNEVGREYELRQMKSDPHCLALVTLNTLEGTAVFDGGSNLNGWLETDGPGELEAFTVSFWFRTGQVSQGSLYNGLFASNRDVHFSKNFPPGKLDWGLYSNRENGGALHLQVFQDKGLESDFVFQPDVWQHVLIRKRGCGASAHTELFLSPVDGVPGKPLLSGDDFDLSLEKIILGVNRNAHFGYRMEVANVKVFDDASVSVEDLFDEGPQTQTLFEPVPLYKLNRTMRDLRREVANLREEMIGFPHIKESLQVDSYGFHSSYLPRLESVPDEPRWTVEFNITTAPGVFSECYLVPAADRRVSGMPGYGFPKRFRIYSVDFDGEHKVLADWRTRDYPDPGRCPVRVYGSETALAKLVLEVYQGQVETGMEFFALDEVFVRSDFTFIKIDRIEAAGSFESPPFWGTEYLGDQKTSLGLPLMPNAEPANDCYASFHELPSEPLKMEIDLAENRPVDNVLFFPARPPEGIYIPGFGFPGDVTVEFIRESENGTPVLIHTSRITGRANPGNNIVRVPGNSGSVRWLRFSFDQFALHQGWPIFALGEIVVANHREPQVDIAAVRSEFSGVSLLVDGKAGGATVLPMTIWLDGLMRGQDLSKRLDLALKLMDRLQARWEHFEQGAWKVSGVLLLLVSVVALMLRQVGLHKMRLRVEQEHRLAELEQMKIRLFTHISHDLRTPLTVILTRVERLMKRFREEESQASLIKIHRNVVRLKILTDQMLDLRTLQDGQLKMKCIQGNVAEQVVDIAESLRPLAEQKQIDLEVRRAAGDESGWFDPDKLHKIVVNLLANAIKYTPRGSQVNASVRLTKEDPSAGSLSTNTYSVKSGQRERRQRTSIASNPSDLYAVITVEDFGVGIPPSEMPHIFEQFYRVEEMRPVQAVGSGIGLALVKELVDLWGGRIDVKSPLAEGKGTRFTVVLSVAKKPECCERSTESV
ncbi:sensor histidine kinase [Tichowtungia aerotolerans]|uniref:histidine kinase n=1 Tax=Tichowtungia aerotolerans TaxID=2697043 RepID=A0A6P1M4R4_9BACT|nr:HAMP domain-containing sensor histidine kinase [Tichowtungia aerotolerans]QHI67993.1 hypothetical protein GT409_00520 [Tichowtungia aerotolerans]